MKRLALVLLLSLMTAVTINCIAQEGYKRCEGKTVKGVQCKNRVKAGNYCYLHDGSRTTCGAQTNKGTPCKNPVKAKGQRCWRHS